MRSSNISILIVAVLLSALGVLSIYSSNYEKEGQLWQNIYKRQIIWVCLGVLCYVLFSQINYRRLWDATYFLYAATLLLLFLVFILGIVRLGAQRWIRVAWINFQPSEIAKVTVILFLARYFSTKSIRDISLRVEELGFMRSLLIPFALVALPIGLIIEQPDLGTGSLILILFILFLFFAKVKLRYIIAFLSSLLLAFPLLWHYLRVYQKERLLVFLHPDKDPLGTGYTVLQSKIAIGSGGLFGKGWLGGTQSQLHFLPESHTDFIFATFAEEWGFLGSTFLLLLFCFLIWKGFKIGSGTQDQFGRMLAFGIASLFGAQVLINLAMNMGLAPVVGLPLPLMSYGGSSILVTFISLGILANIDRHRTSF